MNYKQIIKNEMQHQRISYTRIANVLGVSRQAIWNILNSDHAPSVDSLEKICDVLNMEIVITARSS